MAASNSSLLIESNVSRLAMVGLITVTSPYSPKALVHTFKSCALKPMLDANISPNKKIFFINIVFIDRFAISNCD